MNRAVFRRRAFKSLFVAGILCLTASGIFSSPARAETFDRKQEDTYYVAVKSFQDGFYDVALTLFDRFLKNYVDSDKRFEALVYMGACYFYQEKYLRALEQFEMLLKMSGAEVVLNRELIT